MVGANQIGPLHNGTRTSLTRAPPLHSDIADNAAMPWKATDPMKERINFRAGVGPPVERSAGWSRRHGELHRQHPHAPRANPTQEEAPARAADDQALRKDDR